MAARTKARKKKKTKTAKTTRTPKKAARARAASARKPAARRSTAAPTRAKTASRGFRPLSGAPSLTVNDIEQSLHWYCHVLGFTEKERWVRDGILRGAELAAGPVTIYLGQDDWQKGRDRVKGEGLRIYWYTDQDIDGLAAEIKARGGTLATEPHDAWGSRTFSLEDPTGYKITIASDR
jgi:uncharacterized glyoxalase superfamily protein PhnB